MGNENRDELDDLIDRALRHYSSASPAQGLEDRVLRRVRVAGAMSGSPWRYRLAFAIPTAAAAAVLLLGIVLWTVQDWQPRIEDAAHHGPAPAVAGLRTPRPEAVRGPVAERAAAAPKPEPRSRPARHGATRVTDLPKKDSFPTPEPMTVEERVLVSWVRREPREVMQAFADLRKPADEPVSIQPLQIQPLHSDDAK